VFPGTNPVAESVVEEIVDVAFRLPGGRLPIDHASALLREISAALPWFVEESDARMHQVHTAATGGGWMRPEDSPGDELHLSRRTRLVLRLPKRRAADALALSGRELDVGGYPLTPGAGKIVALLPASTLLARHVVCAADEEEAALVSRLMGSLETSGVSSASCICGRTHRIATGEGELHTRSVVVTKLDPEGAMFLLRNGIGPAGKLGCGIFIPYKHID
jgi:CRISPR-associated protein Cas6